MGNERTEMLAGVRKTFASKGDDVTLTRFVKLTKDERAAQPKKKQYAFRGMDRPNASVDAGRSYFFRKGVKDAAEFDNVFVSGHNNVKIGRDVRIGELRGYWIYTLSLEERATCPTTCSHWRTCYGNNMPYAKRVVHGAALEKRIPADLAALLAKRNRVGVLVRLHALGDFYSAAYVKLWGRMLDAHANLAVYGYTARDPKHDPIGRAIARLKRRYGRRFAIRYSDGGKARDCTVPIRHESQVPANAFVCPEQTRTHKPNGEPILCGTCGLCWRTDKNVAFIEH